MTNYDNLKRTIDSLADLEELAREIRKGNFSGRLWLPSNKGLEVKVVSNDDGLPRAEQSQLERFAYRNEPSESREKNYRGNILFDLSGKRLSISDSDERNDSSNIIVPKPQIITPNKILVPLGGYNIMSKLELAIVWRYLVDTRRKREAESVNVNTKRNGFTDSERAGTNLIYGR